MNEDSDEKTKLASQKAPDLAELSGSGSGFGGFGGQSRATRAELGSALRVISPTERKYRRRRFGVVFGGALILLAPVVFVWVIFTLLDSPGGSAGREFVGDFSIRAHVSSEYNTLPGGPPTLRVTSLPELNVETGEWVIAFDEAIYDPERLQELYAEFVSAQVAFVIFENIYAVTTNGGHSWQVWNSWDATQVQDTLESGEGFVIDGVLLDETGSGMLFPVGVQAVDSAWVTDDFGVSWESRAD